MSMVNVDDLKNVVVHAHGQVSAREHAYAHDKIALLARSVLGPVRSARVDLIAYADPARKQSALAKAELDIDGKIVRAHAEAQTMAAAVDALQGRLRHRLERFRHRAEAQHLRHRGDGSWRHGDAVEARAAYFPRPAEDRQIVRRKTFALDAMTPDDAALDLEALDHDFYLFRNAHTDADNVIQRVGEDQYELLEPAATHDAATGIDRSTVHAATLTTDDALEFLDLGGEPFVFFIDVETGRGAVVYRRYDGHYGLVVATDVGADGQKQPKE
jgi:ribosome-associated translation inhibitor RaiA